MILGRQRLKVLRDIGGTHIDGKYQPSLGPAFFVSASVQPMDPQTVQMLPESARVTAKFTLFASTRERELKTTDLAGQTEADRIKYRGRQYRLISGLECGRNYGRSWVAFIQ